MRYVWDLYDDYFGQSGPAIRALTGPLAARLRRWDRATSDRVHDFVAISEHIADRIRRCYGRPADVIYPPVDVQRFEVADEDLEGEFYLVVSALVPYKRLDLAVEAANRLRCRLVVVGTGPEERRLRTLAGPTVDFLGWRSDAEVAELYRRSHALLFPGVEDFGITPLEAMAAGRPVIAFAAGGALETVVSLDTTDASPTGVLFHEQTADALVSAMWRFESARDRFSPKALRRQAEAFDRPRFKQRVAEYLQTRLAGAPPC